MQRKNSWIHHLRFKLFAVLCVALLGQGLLIRPALAHASDRDPRFSVISRSSGKLDIFIVRNGEIWMKSWTGSLWTSWRSLGRAANGDPFYTVYAVASGNNRWDIFSTVGVFGNRVWHKFFDGVVEFGWESRGDVGRSSPYGIQAVSTGNGQLDLFTRESGDGGTGNALWKRRSANGVWTPCDTCNWTALDNTASDFSFTALAHSGNRIDIFRRSGTDQRILRKYYNGTSWGPVNFITKQSLNVWQDMGGWANETPYAVSWGTSRIDVFVRGTDDNVYIDSTDDAGAHWYGWGFLGRGATNNTTDASAVSAVAWGLNRLDVFMREDTTVYHKAWTGTNWWPSDAGGWENLGSMPTHPFAHPPLPVSWGSSRIDLFYYEHTGGETNSQTLYHKWTNGSGWGPSQTEWENLGP